MKKALSLILSILMAFSLVPTMTFAAGTQTHTCHTHTNACFKEALTCGAKQHPHTEQCCSIAEHTHTATCEAKVVYTPQTHKCSDATGCVTTSGCNGKHHTADCYVTIDSGSDFTCPSYHFNADGSHKDISCPNTGEPDRLLACLDPNHHEQTASCNPATVCAHKSCGTDCTVCYKATTTGGCTIAEHQHGAGCNYTGCKDAHHTAACYSSEPICGKIERPCTPENCQIEDTEDPKDPEEPTDPEGPGGSDDKNPVDPEDPKDPEIPSGIGKIPFVDILTLGSGSGKAIQFVYENGLFEGVSRNEFAPHMTMTRGMFVTVLGRLADINEGAYSGSRFTDVQAGAWYAPGVAWASQNGIVQGYGDGTFGVNDDLTVEQAVVILERYARYLGVDTTSDHLLSKFSDKNLVAAWAYEQMQWAVENEIYGGKGKSLVPQNPASRQLVAELIYNFASEYLN